MRALEVYLPHPRERHEGSDARGSRPGHPRHGRWPPVLPVRVNISQRERGCVYSRRSPFLTTILEPMPSARRSIRASPSDPHGQLSHTGSIAPPCVRVHRLALPVATLFPHAAQTSYSSEASRTRTFERNTWRLSMERSAGASACAVASYSITYAGCDLASRLA